MKLRKRRRSKVSSDPGIKPSKQTKIDYHFTSSQGAPDIQTEIELNNRYKILESLQDEDLITTDKVKNSAGSEHLPTKCPWKDLLAKEAFLISKTFELVLKNCASISNGLETLIGNLQNVERTNYSNRSNPHSTPLYDYPNPSEFSSALKIQSSQVMLAIGHNSINMGRWSNIYNIKSSLSKLLGWEFSKVMLKSFYFLPSVGHYSRLILTFNSPAASNTLLAKKSSLIKNYDIHCVRVYTNSVINPLISYKKRKSEEIATDNTRSAFKDKLNNITELNILKEEWNNLCQAIELINNSQYVAEASLSPDTIIPRNDDCQIIQVNNGQLMNCNDMPSITSKEKFLIDFEATEKVEPRQQIWARDLSELISLAPLIDKPHNISPQMDALELKQTEEEATQGLHDIPLTNQLMVTTHLENTTAKLRRIIQSNLEVTSQAAQPTRELYNPGLNGCIQMDDQIISSIEPHPTQ